MPKTVIDNYADSLDNMAATNYAFWVK